MAVGFQMAIGKILIWRLQRQTAKPPNLIPHQIFQLYGTILNINFTTVYGITGIGKSEVIVCCTYWYAVQHTITSLLPIIPQSMKINTQNSYLYYRNAESSVWTILCRVDRQFHVHISSSKLNILKG